ncbi:MAG: chondroitinase-B domain-containing protein, partial [Candidatus Latescibacterota bacterium]
MLKRSRLFFVWLVVILVLWLPIPGEGTDFNGDGKVDFSDFILFARGYQEQDEAFDLNADGVVGFGDFLVFARAFAQSGREIKVTDVQALNAAIASAQPGDRIVMGNGIWRDVDILFAAKGDAGRLITLVAEKPGKVILTGHSRLRFSGKYLVVDGLWFKDGALTEGHVIQFRRDSAFESHYCRLTNTAITNYNPPTDTIEYKWISLFGTHNRVDHCFVSGKNHDGAAVVVWVGEGP